MNDTREKWLPEPLRRLVARVRSRPDSEFQQAVIRVVIACVFYAYFAFDWQTHAASIKALTHPLGVGFLLIAGALLLGAIVEPKASPMRRVIGMVLDVAMMTVVLSLSGESGAPVAAIYLWVTLGNGFRYGVRYLLAAMVLSVASFSYVIATNPFWQQHSGLALGMLITLIAVPLYSLALLRQLHNATARAIEASHAKSRFLANMSHELRTPLNGVIGVADLLAETRLDKDQKEYAQIIRSSADTLLKLIDDVLDISRIEAGRLSTEAEDFDLHRLVNGTIVMLEPQASKKGLALAAHIAPQTPFLLNGDARHIRQVLINLIGNAIKFTEHGRVDVYVRPVGQGNPRRLRFEVVDTGIGIPEAVQPQVFDSFTQADASITRRYGGTGLGTAIAKQLVDVMHGQIGLASREGEGSTFWFEIPLALQGKATEARPEQFETPMRVAILAGSDLAARLQDLIRTWDGQTVVVKNTARLAAELATQDGGAPVDAVVVERACLPGDAVAFVRILRDDPALASLPVILIDSAASASDAHLLREGFASVLGTPVNPTLLFNAIHAAVSHELPQNVVSLADRFQAPVGAKKPRILVAEDNPVNQRVLRGLLDHAGFDSVLAHDGEAALALLESDERFDLAIIDMHMPGLSGPEVVQRWRFMESGHLPILMLTADARSDAEAACREAGADAFLTKPVGSRDLVAAIATLLPGQAAPQATPAPPQATAGVLDESVLGDLALMGGGQAFVQELIDSFGSDAERNLNAADRALAAGDYAAWHDELHMLKGGARDLGAQRLAAACADAERIRPYEMATPVARERLAAVRTALAEALGALAAYVDRALRADRG